MDYEPRGRLEWRYGDKAKLADMCGISRQYMCDLISRRKRALPELARLLCFHAALLGYRIDRNDWLYPEESTHPLLRRVPASK